MPKSRGRQSRRVTQWDSDEERTPTQQLLYDHYKAHYQERHPALNTTGEDIFINSFVPETSPALQQRQFPKI